ncbi:Mur ligase domain-containing protein, partial [Rhizobium sp. BR5]
MNLRDISGAAFPELKELLLSEIGAIEIGGITADSRKAAPGGLFVAVSGTKADGATYVKDAVAKGAVAVVSGHA